MAALTRIRAFPKFGYNPVTGEWNDSLTGEFLWSGVNLREGIPDIMTPSTWSLLWVYFYETGAPQLSGDFPMFGNICGRPYFNLSVISSIYHAVGMDAREEKMGDLIGSMPADLNIPFIPFSSLRVLRDVLPGVLRDHWHAWRDHQQIQDFLIMVPDWCRSMRGRIQETADAADLLSLWTGSIRPMLVRGLRMLRSMTLALSEPATKLNLELTALVGEAEASTLLSNLSGASGDLECLGPLFGLAKVQEGSLSRERYMERYGHRGPHETELSAPEPGDDPEWLDKKLAEFTRSAVDLEALLAKQRSAFSSAWQRLDARFPQKTKTLREKLEIVRAAAKNREAIRSESIRVSRLVRQFLLQAGRVTGIMDDIFFLSLDEMTGVLAGDRLPLPIIPARREMVQRYRLLPSYPALIYGSFDPFQWAADSNRRSDLYDARRPSTAATTSTIKGFPGAAGCVEGFVRRIDCPEDSAQLQPGEILVTVTTNVGWTPLFPPLAAIVTDVGAPLSHAAIIARELGIPAVVGCGNATMRLQTGDRIRVDGEHGTIEILERAARNT